MALHYLLRARATTECSNGNDYTADGYECGKSGSSSGGGGGGDEGDSGGKCSANDNYVQRVLLFKNSSMLFILTVYYIHIHIYTFIYIHIFDAAANALCFSVAG